MRAVGQPLMVRLDSFAFLNHVLDLFDRVCRPDFERDGLASQEIDFDVDCH